MKSPLGSNIIMSDDDDDWLPESHPCVHESSIAMRRKIGKFDNAVGLSYVKHQASIVSIYTADGFASLRLFVTLTYGHTSE